MLNLHTTIPCSTGCSTNTARPGRRRQRFLKCQAQRTGLKHAQGSQVAMRDLPFARPHTDAQPTAIRRPPQQQAERRQLDVDPSPSEHERSRQSADAARRSSNAQASTSSSASSGNKPLSPGLRSTSTSSAPASAHKYEAAVIVDQAVPGFRSAAQQASVASEQRAQSLIQAELGRSPHHPMLTILCVSLELSSRACQSFCHMIDCVAIDFTLLMYQCSEPA